MHAQFSLNPREDNPGFIVILRNAALPGLLALHWTTADPNDAAQVLSAHGEGEFWVEVFIEVSNLLGLLEGDMFVNQLPSDGSVMRLSEQYPRTLFWYTNLESFAPALENCLIFCNCGRVTRIEGLSAALLDSDRVFTSRRAADQVAEEKHSRDAEIELLRSRFRDSMAQVEGIAYGHLYAIYPKSKAKDAAILAADLVEGLTLGLSDAALRSLGIHIEAPVHEKVARVLRSMRPVEMDRVLELVKVLVETGSRLVEIEGPGPTSGWRAMDAYHRRYALGEFLTELAVGCKKLRKTG